MNPTPTNLFLGLFQWPVWHHGFTQNCTFLCKAGFGCVLWPLWSEGFFPWVMPSLFMLNIWKSTERARE